MRRKKWQKRKMRPKSKSQGRKGECRENEVKSHGEIEWEPEKRARIATRKLSPKRAERVLVML